MNDKKDSLVVMVTFCHLEGKKGGLAPSAYRTITSGSIFWVQYSERKVYPKEEVRRYWRLLSQESAFGP